jgi:hypothetical protein
MTAITESPVYILFNPAVSAVSKDLPITLYESGAQPSRSFRRRRLRVLTLPPRRRSELHVVGDAPKLTFVKSTYTIEARTDAAHCHDPSLSCRARADGGGGARGGGPRGAQRAERRQQQRRSACVPCAKRMELWVVC